ncbi:RepB family plasmid replication initiator protein [Allochromatium palmeri]|uniref:RepB family plasmid replication initiator protein n=1 Tax=Allochromatium palmeri TaxID=231048 RepID=A0A6N8EJB4_9GAMM|nr:RepB family plasmid replication initiator protein [Allochromatium palmeri]MTW22597.1 RepB family plasmid replication initiator protein [Allochromatium palmeri]
MPRKPNVVVTKSNHLVEATYALSLAEQRLLLLALARVDSRGPLTVGICHTITLADVMEIYGVSRPQAYELLCQVAQRLYARSVVIHGPFPHQPDVSLIETRWVASIRYQDGQGALSIVFAPDILPFLSQLRERFTSYHLKSVASMTSGYAIRLYELLVQWREAGSRTVELIWLRERLQLGGKYPNIRDFKNRILNPAIEQINAHSDLWVKWEQHKRGRVVHALTFTFGPKADPKPDTQHPDPAKSKPVKPKVTRAYIEQHAQPGESWEEARVRLQGLIDQGKAPA